jgi:predicted O-linked N-acetylglucosamine transferase (SPINDLY family)/glycosyltransferase involved in cell wall biosynthesis
MKIAVFDSGWDYTLDTPYNKSLGGTQSAICYFLEELKIKKHDVYLFNKIDNVKEVRGVKHIPAHTYLQYIKDNNLIFDLIIVSCLPHDLFQIKSTLNSPTTLYCLWTGHDIDQAASKILKDIKAKDMIDLFMFVSDYQRNRYIEEYNISYSKTLIMRNGIGKPFDKYLNLPINKIKNSMTYCSIPWRGLDLLQPIFKEIKMRNTDATLKIFSGMNIYQQNETNNYEELKNMKDVIYNTGIAQSELADELYTIDYLTYPNIFPETSCISILQAMACGCLIVTSNLGALKETMNGMNEYVDINIHNFDKDNYINNFVNKLNNLMSLNDNLKDMLRERNREYIKQNYTWNIICDKFEKDILSIIINYRKYIQNDHNTTIENFLNLYKDNKWQESFIESHKIKYYLNLNEYCVIKLNLGVCYYQSSNLDEAKKCFKICKELKNDYNINKNIALLELQRNELHKFVKYARIALSIHFEIYLANLLAEKYELLGLYNDAIALYETIIYLDPENINSYNNLGNLNLLRISQVDDIDKIITDTYGKSLDLCVKYNEHRKKELVLSNIIFNNLYNWTLSNEEVLKRTCDWYKYFPKENKLIELANKLNRKEISKNKIKIGYISCDFITHPVGFMFESILKNHNKDLFEIFCYDCCNIGKSAGDTTAQRLRSYNNAVWNEITDKSDEEVLEIIINDDLDILVDMMGHTRNTRMNILQYKPARILISYFAYPATNGLKEIDYRITDKYASPPESQKNFIEKFYYLPNGFQCYTPPVDIDCTKDYTRDKYKIHLCCFNNPIKLSIPTINMFCEILKRLPEAKLFLRYCYYKSSYYKETVLKLFTDRGIDKERIDIGYEQILDALKLYNKMDIALDPYPYHGGTISLELLYMSTPLISLTGSTYYSRISNSLLNQLGLEKYLASTQEEYIQKTIDLARNEKELKLLHQTIRFKVINSELYDSKKFTINIENAYKDMCNNFIK